MTKNKSCQKPAHDSDYEEDEDGTMVKEHDTDVKDLKDDDGADEEDIPLFTCIYDTLTNNMCAAKMFYEH